MNHNMKDAHHVLKLIPFRQAGQCNVEQIIPMKHGFCHGVQVSELVASIGPQLPHFPQVIIQRFQVSIHLHSSIYLSRDV